MSDPWLKVYAADMRGDPDLALLGLEAQALLIHAWDIARDEDTGYGELRRRDGSPFTPESFARAVPGATLAKTRRFFAEIRGVFAEKMDDGALYFPKLEERQRGSAGAVRQARYRAKNEDRASIARRNDPRNAQRHAVTPPVTPTETAEARSQSKDLTSPNGDVVEHEARRGDIDTVWQEYQTRHPRARLTQPRRGLIRRRLKEYPASILTAAIRGNHLDAHCNGENDRGQTYHDLELIFRDAGHIERYAAVAEPKDETPPIDRARRWLERSGGDEDDLRGVWGDDIADQLLAEQSAA